MSSKSTIRLISGAVPARSSRIVTVRAGSLSLVQTRGVGSISTSRARHVSTNTSSMTSRTVRSGRVESVRMMSSSKGDAEESSAELTPSILSQAEYERISEEDMETLSENLGALCEEAGRESWEVDYSSGVLTLSIPPHGTYVLNKQPPNQQIWISSPISGPSRFGYVNPTPSDPSTTGPMSSESTKGDDGSDELRGAWTHFRRKGVTLGGLVEGELRVLGVGKDSNEGWVGVGIK